MTTQQGACEADDPLIAAQARTNADFWRRGTTVSEYTRRELLPVEVVLLVRYAEAVSGRVLDLGCGAGRLLGYLVELSSEAVGIDISPPMVEHCRRAHPSARVEVGDITALAGAGLPRFDIVFAINNLIDVVAEGPRRQALSAIPALLEPGGLFIFSSHNLDSLSAPSASAPARSVMDRSIAELLAAGPRLLQRRRNRRRLAPLEYRGPDYAVLNDRAQDYNLLHVYSTRAAQERELRECGFEPVEVLDAAGHRLAEAETSSDPWLHYVARASADEARHG